MGSRMGVAIRMMGAISMMQPSTRMIRSISSEMCIRDSCSPSRDNPLCENLKNMQANLNHMTWQAKQVAKRDYSQTVSYLGEFSEAFNTMTAQLRDREKALKKEAQLEKDYADSLKLEAHFDQMCIRDRASGF